MGLASPWFLAGLFALALPVWLHLLKQHKKTPLPFSSLMFFERRIQSSSKHRRLKYLTLLAMRLALLALLALLFAKPFVRTKLSLGDTKKLAVVVVDNSFSMRFGDRLAQAKRQAAAQLNSWGDRPAQVLSLASHVTPLTQVTADRAALAGAVESIQPSDGMSSWSELTRFLRGITEARGIPLEVHFFTDAQLSSMPAAFADIVLQPGTDLRVHSVNEGPSPNWAVESVAAPRQVFDPKRVRVQATVRGFGTAPASRIVSLVLNDRVVATRQVDIPAGARSTVEFLGLEANYGFNRGEVRLEGGGDSLPGDDRFRFSLERADPRRVLVLHDARQGRTGLYIRTALEAGAEGAFAPDVRTAEQAGNLDLSVYSHVVLADTGSLPAGFEESLKRYVQGGGGLLIALGPATAARQKVPVLNLAIQGTRYAARDAERFQLATDLDSGHPVLANVNRLDGVRFFQHVAVDTADTRVLARLSDRSPLLVERRLGEGRVLVFTSGFDNLANDFPIRASFVPFIELSSKYLAGMQGQPLNVAVNSFIELRAGGADGTAAEVIGPDGKRVLSLEESTKAQNFAVTQEGFYDVRRAGGRKELIAVNADRRESDLAPMTAETIALWQNTGKATGDRGGFAGVGETEEKKPLWPWILGAMILLALAESWFANRYLESGDEPELAVRREAA
jgi:hypothetical protein